MEKTKLYRALKSLSREEIADFRAFLGHRQGAANTAMRKYFDVVDALFLHPDAPPEGPDAATVARRVFPDKNPEKLPKSTFAKFNSALLRLVFEFLTREKLEEDTPGRWTYLLEALSERDLDGLFRSELKRARKQIASEADTRSAYWNSYRIASAEAAHELRHAGKQQPGALKEVAGSLDRAYLFEKLRLGCAELNLRLIFGGQPERDTLLEALIGRYPDAGPVLRAFVLAYRTLVDPAGEAHYFGLRDHIRAHGAGFDRFVVQELISHAINYCVRRFHTGDEAFGEELSHLYDTLLESGLLLDRGRLPALHFKNIVNHLGAMKHLDKLSTVIDAFRGHLLDDYRDNAVNYAKAVLHFESGMPKEALAQVRTVLDDHQDIYYAFDCRILELRCFYELEEYDLVEARMEAFRLMIARKQFLRNTAAGRNSYDAFRKFIRTLLRAVTGVPARRQSRLRKLRKAVLDYPQVPARIWLLQKIGEYLPD